MIANPVRTERRGRTGPAYSAVIWAAVIWAAAFALLSFYWAAGGHWGLGTLNEELRQQALARDEGLIVLVWVTGALKVVLALLVLAIARQWRLGVPRRVLRAGVWICGVALALYGAMGIVNGALAELGVFNPTDADGARWYMILWGPVWLTGGLLLLASVWWNPDGLERS